MEKTKPLALLVLVTLLPLAVPPAAGWSNGGYSADPSNPDYGTHDWLAEHALRWLPENESGYLLDNFARYLFGTELPDNSQAPGGIGDTGKHHVYYRSNGTLQDDASAVRAFEEFIKARAYLMASNFTAAAERAGVMSHYLVDAAVFGHVMGASTDWGAEAHHSDFETKVTNEMKSNVSAMFDGYLVFDGSLDFLTAYNATLRMACNTTFGDGSYGKNCTWMDSNYSWSNSDFVNSTGAALNRSANLLADVLHTLAVASGYGARDIFAPSITITSPADGATLESTVVNVTGNASDDVAVLRVEIGIDNASWTICTGNVSWNGTVILPEGPGTIFARATDASNNTNTTSVSVNVSLPDVSPPSIAITSPADGTHLSSGSVAVTGTASDDRGIAAVELSADNANWRPALGTVSWSGSLSLPLGPGTIFARATDSSGNQNATSVGVFVDDVEAPEVGITSPPDGSVLSARNITVAGSAQDDGGIARVDIGTDNRTWVPCIGNSSWTGNLTLGEGQNTIYARATDFSKNENTTSVTVTVNLPDTVSPVVAITSPVEGAVLPSLWVRVSGTASDDQGIVKVEVSVNGSAWELCAGTSDWTGNLTLAEGKNTLLARATDRSGNAGIAMVNVTAVPPDTAPPWLVISFPSEGAALANGSVNVSGTARDDRAIARVEVSSDNSTWFPCAGADPWTGILLLPEGPNTIFARAFDSSGNSAIARINVTVTAPDTTPPTVTILSPANGTVSESGSIIIRGEARDDRGVQKVEVSLDGESWMPADGNASWTAGIALKEGENLVRVRATDAAGNAAYATVVVTYKAGKEFPWMLVGVMMILLLSALMLLALARKRG